MPNDTLSVAREDRALAEGPDVGRSELFNKRLLRIAFYLCVALMVAVSSTVAYLAKRERVSSDWVTHTTQVLQQLERLQLTIVEAESAGQAFLVSGSHDMLVTFRRQVAAIDTELHGFMRLTTDNPLQQQNVQELTPRLTQRFNRLDDMIYFRTSQGVANLQSEQFRPGMEMMRGIKNKLESMKEAENSLLADRKQAQRGEERNLYVVLALMAAIVLGIIGGLFWRVQRLWELCSTAEKLAQHQAFHDALTGLPNRRLFQDRLGMAMSEARRHGRKLAVFCMDLDGFKAVNDTFGHGGGDELLKAVATRLRTFLRSGDTVARLGGDEFVLLATSLETEAGIEPIAGRIIESISAQYSIAGHKGVGVGTSVGVALYSGGDETGSELVARGDAALYDAKRRGRGVYVVAQPPAPR